MVADFLKDFNAATGKNVAATGLYGAGDVYAKFYYTSGMMDKWGWILELFYELGEQKIGYHADSQKQYLAFLDGKGSTVSPQWAVRQNIQGLMTLTKANKYSTAAAIDFSTQENQAAIWNKLNQGNHQEVKYTCENPIVSMPTPSKVGYSFLGWYDGNQLIENINELKNYNLVAKWQINQYTISFNTNEGTLIESITQDYATTVIAPSNPTRSGYVFNGWDQDIPYIMPVGGLTLNALWTEVEYNITYELNGGNDNSSNPEKYYISTNTIQLSNPTKDGYTFVGWTFEGQDDPQLVVKIEKGSFGNKHFIANWVPTKYNITYNLNGGQNNLNNPDEYTIESIIVLLDPTKENYEFAGWTLEGNPITKIDGLYGDIELVANWLESSYSITYDLDGGEWDEIDGATRYATNSSYELPEPIKEGYIFDGWYEGDVKYEIVAGKDFNLVAHWTIKTYKISFDSNGGTEVEEQVIEHFGTVSEPNDPTRTGYAFVEWQLEEVKYNFESEVTGEMILVAVWELEKYTITYNVEGGSYATYATFADIASDLLADYNTYSGKSYTKDTVPTGSWVNTDLDDFYYSTAYHSKWSWIVDYLIATSSSSNLNSLKDLKKYNNVTDFTAANKDVNPYVVSYVFRAIMMIGKFSTNSSFVTTDYSLASTQNLVWNYIGTTQYTYLSNTLPILNPVSSYDFIGWFDENDNLVTEIPSGSYGDLTLYAKWKTKAYIGETPYYSISDAINAAKENDIITILPGEYNENITIGVSNVTILGPNTGLNDARASRADEAILSGTITLSSGVTGLTIDGLAFTGKSKVVGQQVIDFTFTNNKVYNTVAPTSSWDETSAYKTGFIFIDSNSSSILSKNLSFEHNIFENVSDVNVSISYVNNVSFNGNTFSNFGYDAIRFNNGGHVCGTLSFTNNEFSQDTLSGYNGIYFRIYGCANTDHGCHILVDGNKFTNIGNSTTESLYTGAISARNYQERGVDIDIQNNIFEGCINNIRIRNNGTAANHSTYPWNCTVEQNQFIGIPNSYYFASWNGTTGDNESSAPIRCIFGQNYYEDNEGNVINDLTGYVSYFKEVKNIGTTLTYRPGTYFVTYELYGGVNNPNNIEIFTKNEKFTFYEPTKEGYTFEGWYTDSSFENVITKIELGTESNVALYAKWKINQYTLTIDLDNGMSPIVLTLNYGADIPEQENPTKDGYTFAGWSSAIPSTMPSKDVTIKATWNIVNYTITYDYAGGLVKTYYSSREAMVTDFISDFNSIANASITNPAEYWAHDQKTNFWRNAEMHAKWSWIFEELIPIAKKQGVDTQYLENMLANPISISGYATQNVAIYLLGINSSIWVSDYQSNYGSLAGRYTTVDCTSEEVKNTWINNDGNLRTYTILDSFELLELVKEGYEFLGYYIGEEKITSVNSGTTGNLNIVAKWSAKSYTISYELDGGETINPDSYTIESENITLNAPTKEGYTFLGWTFDGQIEPTLSVTISKGSTGNRTYFANWEVNKYTIKYYDYDGTLLGTEEVNYGATIPERENPTKDGYTFVEWSPAVPNTMPLNGIEVTAVYGIESESWKLVTDVSQLTVGDKVVIVANEYDYVLSTTQNKNNRGQTPGTKNANTIILGADAQIITLEEGAVAGTFAFNVVDGYLYAASSSSNYLRTEASLSENSSWLITISNGIATIVAQGTNTKNTMQYNSGSSLFSCYDSASQKAISIYKATKEFVEVEFINVTYKTYDGSQTIDVIEAVKGSYVTLNDGTALNRDGFTFIGWSKDINATEASYENPWKYTFSENITLYEVWKENITVSFNINGGTGSIESITQMSGTNFKVPSISDITAPEGYQFMSWKDEEGNEYYPEQEYVFTKNTILSAVWEEVSEEYQWELVTNVNNLKVGDNIVIVATDSNYALSTTQNSNNRGQASVVKDGNVIKFGNDVQIITLEEGAVAGTFAFNVGNGYLYAASSSSNYLRTEETLSANSSWVITISDGVVTIVAQGTNTSNTMQYNSGSSLFSCYASATQKAISIYKQTIICDHTFTEEVTTSATCTTNGVKTYTCSKCSDSYTEVIPATGHNYVDGVCSNCGESESASEPILSESLNVYASTGSLENKVITWEGTNFTFQNAQGSTSIRTSDTDHYRIYANSGITIAVNDSYKLTEVVITATSTSYAEVLKTSIENAGYTATISGSVVTVTFAEGQKEMTFTASAQIRINTVEVFYK